MKRRVLIAVLTGTGLLVFVFAPVLYDLTWDYPPGVHVTYYQSPSCFLLDLARSMRLVTGYH